MHSKQSIKISLFIIFSISGFSGLIYESIWTHYLKLVLGHAAHSQTLVLAIFMGGMAIGAWFISKRSKQISNPILVYAAIELIVGFMALFFHQTFVASQNILYTSILPSIESSNLAIIIRWSWATLLILPQSILLGATFPLMSAGIVRLFPKQTGSILAMLYFTNSIGAAIGVLVSGFILIELVGLPGTILTAGILNIFLAIFVWAITKSESIQSQQYIKPESETTNIAYPYTRILLIASFLTGLASFFYEIGWIRMLNLVLGSTSQSFELMLSAFITGIAFGGLWIRKHIDKIQNVIHFSGYIQIIMGLLALSTLILYNSTFDFMHFMMSALHRNESGYALFISSSHLIAFTIMVPTTFMAGMTLPLFTFSYMKAGYGEKGIGRIYSANTLGSIIGIFLAVHLVMPIFGLKNLIAFGAFVDIALGLTLLYIGNQKVLSFKIKTIAIASVSLFLIVSFFAEFDKSKMASAIYREGKITVKPESIIFHKDGKTSTVDVQEFRDNNNILSSIAIRTNGKPDASAAFNNFPPLEDEPTMLLSAVLPLSAHPESKTAAVIGIGSGISSNTLLKTNRLVTVDTIEIESAMVEGAKYFEHHSELVFTDPRSKIHIDDAKSFFSVNSKTYDLILSEPSNPWVSGVASLFTEEFYTQVKPHLNKGGVFAQWLQVYEINTDLVATVFKALNNNFKYYVVYQTVNVDIIILASDDEKILTLDPWIFNQKPLNEALNRLNIKTLNDLYARRIATKKTLEPLFMKGFAVQPNSDFFPYLSKNAPKARFMEQNALDFTQIPYTLVPVMDLIDPLPQGSNRLNTTLSRLLYVSSNEKTTNDIYEHLINNKPFKSSKINNTLNIAMLNIRSYLDSCYIADNIDQSFVDMAEYINMHLPTSKTNMFWDKLLKSKCANQLESASKLWLGLYKAVGQRNPKAIINNLIFIRNPAKNKVEMRKKQIMYYYMAGLSAYIAEHRLSEARAFSNQNSYIFNTLNKIPLNIKIMHTILGL
jgi:spermidine synthase